MVLDATTSEPVSQPNPPDSQADEPVATTEAVEENKDTQTSSEEQSSPDNSQQPEAPADDNSDDFKDWAAKKNLPLDNPEKLGRMYRDLETKLGSEERKEVLKSAVNQADETNQTDDVQALRNEVTALGFFMAHPEARQYETAMVSILEDKPYLANDLETVLDAAKGRTATDAELLVAERKAGAKDALATAANAQRGARPKASATQSNYDSGRITSENVDSAIAAHMGDKKWYDKHRAEIDAALA